jgi:hypothetical protein
MSQPDQILTAIRDLAALSRADAFALADQIRDMAIARFERDPAMPQRCYREWFDSFAGLYADIAVRISRCILDHVHRDDVIDAVEAAIPWECDE